MVLTHVDLNLYMSRGKFTAYVYVCIYALQYTTACLQALFPLQYLVRITKITQ